jgi:hypothetical protein
MIWYDMIWYDRINMICYAMLWYMIWINMICDAMIWYDILYDIIYIICFMIWYEMIYDMIYLTAIGLPPGGSSTVHSYTQTIHKTTKNKQNTEQHNNLGSVRAVPRLCKLYPLHLPYNWGKSTEKPQIESGLQKCKCWTAELRHAAVRMYKLRAVFDRPNNDIVISNVTGVCVCGVCCVQSETL